MASEDHSALAVFKDRFTVSDAVIDANGHVNNVAYVQWMQDLAVQHWLSLGGMKIDEDLGSTWVVRSHKVEYLHPAFVGDDIEARTWVANIGRVRSLRKYAFIRVTDNQLLARGETDWVFIRMDNGRPRPIPDSIRLALPIIEEDERAIS